MTVFNRIFSVLGCVVGLVMAVMPAIWLLGPKSPLHSSDAKYIDAYALGMMSVFFPLTGIMLVIGHVRRLRHSGKRPAG